MLKPRPDRISLLITSSWCGTVPRALALLLEQTEILLQSSDGVTVQPQLGDDVLRQVGLDPLIPSGLTLGRLQQLI